MNRKLTKRKTDKFRAIDISKSRKAKKLFQEAERMIAISNRRSKVDWKAIKDFMFEI